MNIGIVILATNGYFPLGIRLIKRFNQFYKGESEITYYLFSDKNPKPYLPDNIDCKWSFMENKNWVDGTNMKFKSILSLSECKSDHLYYVDADTNISKPFSDWFIGEMVGGEHYGNRGYTEKPFDRNPNSQAYVPKGTNLPQMYYYGAFFGGEKEKMLDLCAVLKGMQKQDKTINYEPVWNDESYLNKIFHYVPPQVIKCEDFMFDVSDKGGIGETRNMNLDISELLEALLVNKEKNINIVNGKVIEVK